MSSADPDAPPTALAPARRRGSGSRIHGIDVARGLAMLGMVIVHYVWAGDDTGPAAAIARAMEGRAMPLFMLLGGVGVVLVSRRSAHPDRGLVIRAVLLAAIGFILHETTERIAIVLQYYGFLFALAPLFRRLPASVLGVAAVITTAVGGVTYQVVGSAPRTTPFGDLLDGWPALRSLLFDGYYPFFPVFAFFALGMVIARLDLRDRRVAALLAGGGTVVGLVTMGVADGLARVLDVDPTVEQVDEAGRGVFVAARLLDSTGHSAMPAWVISAAGTSVAVLGLSLLVAPLAPRLVRPLAVVGAMALTFYAFQALATNLYPSPHETGPGREWLTVAELYGGFAVAALVWRRFFRRGPLEALLRIGSSPRGPRPRRRPEAPAPPPPLAGTPRR